VKEGGEVRQRKGSRGREIEKHENEEGTNNGSVEFLTLGGQTGRSRREEETVGGMSSE
jgi:hypothetical protein